MIIDAFYSFKTKENGSGTAYVIKKESKIGHNDLLNLVFEYIQEINLNKIGPIDNANGYIAYSVKGIGPMLEYGPIIFETSIQSKGFGLVKSLKKEDAILFRRFSDGVFEVYVFKGRYTSSILLLQMLRDGEFIYEIERIKAVLDNL